jgi:glycosyltransferase involved in cell wall biosynthesis
MEGSPMTTVSVVIPVRNGARYIAEAIRSALGQGDVITELVVVDDASTDGTAEVARVVGDSRVRVVPNRTTGLPAGRNTGTAHSTGEWLYYLDADDRVRPGALDALLAAGRHAPRADVVYGDYERVDSQGRRLGRRSAIRFRRKPSGYVLPALLQGNCMVVGAQIVRRSALAQAGGFNESLRCLEDWHFWCRVSSFADFLHVPGCHVLDYRIHNASMMHAAPRPFVDFRPAIDAVFADPMIAARIPPLKLAALRPPAEASLMAYVATEAIRLRAYGTALRSALRAAWHAPAHSPKVAARVFGTFAGL